MDHQFWLDKWRANQLGFHRDSVHPFLTEHWPALGLAPGSRALVPLCGKALDLHWLAEAGHRVLGIELSELAVAAFFAEAGLRPTIDQAGPFRRYRAGPIEILAGDFFDLTVALAGEVAAIFDRAALVALPEPQRRAYVAKIRSLTAPGTAVLLVTLEYPGGAINPPPFSLDAASVAGLYRDWTSIEWLGERADQVKGVACREHAYRLRAG